MKLGLVFLSLLFICGSVAGSAKKVKNSFSIEKVKGSKNEKNIIGSPGGVIVNLDKELWGDSIALEDSLMQGLLEELKKISFAGYDKEINSRKESFLIVNKSDREICGFKVRIDYYDMKGGMLHSRILQLPCDLPAGENRRMDIDSWDVQHTYYYYLGNEPRKVATPYSVAFTPLAFFVPSI